MTNISNELAKKLVADKKYDTIQEYASIAHMGQKPIMIREYTGTEVRAFEQDGVINVLYPEKPTAIQESALAKALTTGSIFDDAEEASRCATYIRLTIIPQRAFAKSNPVDLPKSLGMFTKACVGQMDDEGRLPCNDTCVANGHDFEKAMLTAKDLGRDHGDIIRHHLSIPDSEEKMPMFLAKDAFDVKKKLTALKPINPEGSLEREDYDEIDPTADAEDDAKHNDEEKVENTETPESNEEPESDDETEGADDELKDALNDADEVIKDAESEKDDDGDDNEDDYSDRTNDDDEDDTIEEGFLLKRPKKLKPLPARDIVSYITVEMNAIKDTNDQAMLSGYTCSKLELVDFYINCLDTSDDRYVVPHNRAYLVQFQTDLNRLLTQILAIKPVNKQDRVWKINVNYPDGWRG